jgi:type II restriction/modification system DNA methylase subunit YeeA
LNDTGEFYASLHVEFDEGGFYITSTDDKAKYLLARYGTTIFRLTDENLTELIRDYIKPSLAEKMRNKLLYE